jgi:hypothetical protein
VDKAGSVTAAKPNALRSWSIAAGMVWAVAFVAIGLRYELHFYGDGSIFSYAVAVRDAWAFHWHNISGRIVVYLFASLPAETYAGWTGDTPGAVTLYGFLFFVAPLLGLAATYAADRSPGRTIFSAACLSTACLLPLVFGCPTEMWGAHALLWPTLALCHFAPERAAGRFMLALAFVALVLSHEGALIAAGTIVAALALRGLQDRIFVRAIVVFGIAIAVWFVVKTLVPPDEYAAAALRRIAAGVFELRIFTWPIVILIAAAFAGYGLLLLLLQRSLPRVAHWISAAIVGSILVAYWLSGPMPVHSQSRYYLRTALIVLTPGFGVVASLLVLDAIGRLPRPIAVSHLFLLLKSKAVARAALGALAVVTLIHAVELARFTAGWGNYKTAVRALAEGAESDPSLGDPQFVSAARIGPPLDQWSWFSTTPYLSALVAHDFLPSRLVIDPAGNYFWISCETATANAVSAGPMPLQTRRLIATYSCLHRPHRTQ